MKKNDKYYFWTILSILFVLLISHVDSQAQTKDVLREGFVEPPHAAMPRTWWHWTKGNISKMGITKDLEWMKSVGIAGFQLADVAVGTGQETDEKIDFASDKWLDAVHHAGVEADRLDLEMTMFSSAGWSLTGGPWVKPEQAMKKLVWSELQLEGGINVNTKLPLPPTEIGPFKNMERGGPGTMEDKKFYKDVVVIAFRTPTRELLHSDRMQPTITTSSGAVADSLLLHDDFHESVKIKPGADGKAWITYTYANPIPAKNFTIAGPEGIPYGRLLTSNDGEHYTPLVILPGKQGYRGGKVRTFSFPEVTAKYYRFEFTGSPMTPAEVISEAPPTPDSTYIISQLVVEQGGRINRWEDKAGFNFLFEYEHVATPTYHDDAYIKSADVINISDKMSEDGILNWEAPAGNWTIMRFGYSLTGAKNRPATAAGLGYEVDKLSKEHTMAYLDTYTGLLKKALGNLYGTRLTHFMLDSWEAGIQNWTDKMPAEFQQKRHYDLLPYMPALTGRIVDNPTVSDRFLWDFRRTLVDMFAENHYQVITDYLHKDGLKTYAEAGGVSLESIEDALLNKKYVDIPMGEFWVRDLHPTPMYEEDVKGAVSAAHVYGKKIVAAESFTGGNYESPYTLKKIADYYMAKGLNRLVFHTSAHQPLDTKPGNTMVGTHFHRNITWADMAKPFVTYLSRNSYMLQQGRNVADIAYLLPEGAPSTMPFWGEGLQPSPPKGYQFDYINTDALLSRMSVNRTGELVMPDGTQYGVLVLPRIQEMSLPLIQKIHRLVDSGATIVGPKPLASPSLTGYPASDKEVRHLATELWGDLDGQSRTIRYFGKGKVFWGRSLSEVLNRNQIQRDLDYSEPLNGKISWNHRKSDVLDIYFIVNGSDEAERLDLRFRVEGKYPEIWSPDKGTIKAISYKAEKGTTRLQLSLQQREAVFVVFSTEKTAQVEPLRTHGVELPFEWTDSWRVTFPLKEAEKTRSLPDLRSWTVDEDEDIKYYSGTATYSNSFTIQTDDLPPGAKIMMDLGDVRDIAQVSLNGHLLDTLWKAPYLLDVGEWIRDDKNILEIKVTNEWTNRLVGDQLLPPEQRHLDAFIRPFGGKYQLEEAGLLGKVNFYFVKPITSIIH